MRRRDRSALVSWSLLAALLCFPRGSFARSRCLLNGKVFELRTSLELLAQPTGLRASTGPGVALFVAIFHGHFFAFQGASPASVPDLASQPRKLALQLDCSLVENISDLVAKIQKRFH